MKKIFLNLLTIGLLALPVTGLALVTTMPPEVPATRIESLPEVILSYVFAIFLILAAICFIVGGYYFIFSAGDPEKVAKGRNYVIYGVVGVVVAVGATGLRALARKLIGQ